MLTPVLDRVRQIILFKIASLSNQLQPLTRGSGLVFHKKEKDTRLKYTNSVSNVTESYQMTTMSHLLLFSGLAN